MWDLLAWIFCSRCRNCPRAEGSSSLKISPRDHFENWQQDPHGNFLLRAVFPDKANEFRIEVDLVAEMTVINPFDFFVEPSAEQFPFEYELWLAKEVEPYLEKEPVGPHMQSLLGSIDCSPQNTVSFLVDLNRRLQHDRSDFYVSGTEKSGPSRG